MLLDLKKLFMNEDTAESFQYSLDLTAYEYDGGTPFVKPVRIEGTVSNNSGVIKLAYSVEFSLKKPCDRCAVVVEKEYSYSFQHTLVTQLNGEDTGELLLVEDNKLDMDELVIADILLELPMKFLCSPDCKGLCPQCGVNKNVEQCSCTVKQIDPRLEILKNLMDESLE